jgi:hypothetical protein
MRRKLLIACAANALIAATMGAHASDYSAQTAATKEYHQKALAVYKQLGAEAAVKEFNIPKKWFEKDPYVLHVGLIQNDTLTLADSGFPELNGVKYNDVDDLDGKSLVLLSQKFTLTDVSQEVATRDGFAKRRVALCLAAAMPMPGGGLYE